MLSARSRVRARAQRCLLFVGVGVTFATTGSAGTSTDAARAVDTGLVAAYSFDDVVGASVTDVSGNGNTGTIRGATPTTSGRYGSALAFDGVDDWVTVVDAATLDLTTRLTVEAWVAPDTGDARWRSAVIKEHAAGLSYALYANTNASRAGGYVRVGSGEPGIEGGSSLGAGSWTHLATTYDGRRLRLWIDGTNVATRNVRGSLAPSDLPLRIGGNAYWGEWFDGRIDEVRIYDGVRSQAQIAADMATPIGGDGGGPDPGDTEPPTTPTGLTMTGATATTISLAWNPSSDDVGVAGYDVYRDGVRIATTSTTDYTFTNLACGTTYTLAVEAFDAAGNRSLRDEATTVRSTTSCGGSPANVFVSRTGSDTNPCTSSAPCATFDRAYHVAASGAVVEVGGGTYPAQTLTADASKAGPTPVTIRPAAGASVTTAAIYVGGASYVSVRGIVVDGRITVENRTYSTPGSTNVTFDSMTAKTIRIVGRVSNVTVTGGSYGNTVDNQPQVKKYNPTDPEYARPYNTLIENASFLNFTRSGSSVHTECLQILHAELITIRGNRFDNCDGTGAIGVTDGPTDRLTIENNFLGREGDAYFTMQITKNVTNLVVRFNSSAKAFIFSDTESGGPYLVSSNYAPYNPSTCTSGVTYSYNVFAGGRCSSSDRQVTAMRFVDEARFDLHLGAGSEAVDAGNPSSFPGVDIDGESRPLGTAPDAGADEAR